MVIEAVNDTVNAWASFVAVILTGMEPVVGAYRDLLIKPKVPSLRCISFK